MHRSHNTNDRAGDNERTANATERGIRSGVTCLPRGPDPDGQLVRKPATGGTSQAAGCCKQDGMEAAVARLVPESPTGAREGGGSEKGTGVGARESGREALRIGSLSWRTQGDDNQDTKAELSHMSRLAGVTVLLLVLVDSEPCRAQAFPLGRWTGSALAADHRDVPLTFDVTLVSDSLRIILHTMPSGAFRLDNIRLNDDTLRFAFQPAPRSADADPLAPVWGAKCMMLRQPDRSYAGTCTGPNGMPGTMRMVPPR